jgi:tetratricopeptide (TPR) repeat protein
LGCKVACVSSDREEPIIAILLSVLLLCCAGAARGGGSDAEALVSAVQTTNVTHIVSIIRDSPLPYAPRFPPRLAPAELDRLYVILTDQAREQAGDIRINFALGRVCAARGDYARAQLAFERVLLADPAHDRARLELADAYAAAGRASAARPAYEAVLGRKPPPAVERRIRERLARLDRPAGRWDFDARVDAGWLQDDNVNIGPSAAVIGIAPTFFGSEAITRLTVAENAQPVEADGPFASACASLTCDTGRPGFWTVSLDGSYYQNWLGDASDHESAFVQGGLRLQRATRRRLRRFAFTAARVKRGGEPLADVYTFRPAAVRVTAGGRAAWISSALCEWRDYDTLDPRDGVYAALGRTYRRLLGRSGHALYAGASLFGDFTDASEFQRYGARARLGGEIRLHTRAALFAQAQYGGAWFVDREALAPEDRQDRELDITAGLTTTLHPRWGIDLRYRVHDTASTFDLYEYDRNVMTVATWVTF